MAPFAVMLDGAAIVAVVVLLKTWTSTPAPMPTSPPIASVPAVSNEVVVSEAVMATPCVAFVLASAAQPALQ